jgi:hypothetical protein
MLHVHYACPCCSVHDACPCCLSILHAHVSMLHIHALCRCCISISPCCMSMPHIHPACPCLHAAYSCCISMLLVHAACPCCMSTAVCPCCLFMLKVHATCPYCILCMVSCNSTSAHRPESPCPWPHHQLAEDEGQAGGDERHQEACHPAQNILSSSHLNAIYSIATTNVPKLALYSEKKKLYPLPHCSRLIRR